MIRSPRIPVGNRRHTQVLQRCNPLRKNRPNRRIPLRVHPTNLACAVVHVEIRAHQLLLGLHFQRPRRAAHKLRQRQLVRLGGKLRRTKVLRAIALRSENPLLFARPQCNPDSPPRLHAQRLQNPHRLHRHHGSRAVVRRARAGNPAIQVAAHHHHLLLQRRVRSRNLRHRVERVLVIARELRLHVNLHLHRHMRLCQPVQPPVALNRSHSHRHLHPLFRHIRRPPQRRAVVVKQRAARSAAILRVPARLNHRRHLLVRKKLRNLVNQPLPFHVRRQPPLHIRAHPASARHLKLCQVRQLLIRVPLKQSLVHRRNITHRPVQNNLAFQFALVLVKILVARNRHKHHIARHRPRRRGRPRRRLHNQNRRIRARHPRPRIQLLPAQPKLAPVLQVRVLQANLRQRIPRPLVRLLQVRRTRQPRPNPVHQR